MGAIETSATPRCLSVTQHPNGSLHDCGRKAIFEQVWKPIDNVGRRTTFRCELHQLLPGPQLVSTAWVQS